MTTDRDFYSRELAEQEYICANTWCGHCAQADLGLEAPVEYEEAGRVYVAGKCAGCKRSIVTEIQEAHVVPSNAVSLEGR